eukprot:g27134.t1
MVSKFADDTKISGVMDSEEDYLRVQEDPDQMDQWAEDWQMELNLDKWLQQHGERGEAGESERPTDHTRSVIMSDQRPDGKEWGQ